MKTKLMALEALKNSRKELHACQSVIHLAGGFDPEYVRGAQAAMKNMDEAIAALEADIAKPGEPVAFLFLPGLDGEEFSDDFQVEIVAKEAEKLQEALVQFSDQDGVTIPLYTTPQEPAAPGGAA